jgi:hypothetical protein
LSKDRTLSSEDHLLVSDPDNEVPAGCIGFTSTVTWYSGWTLPSGGTYYVFLKLSPGFGAPTDSNTSNNVIMDPNPIQVDGDPPPLPPVDPYPDNGAIEQPLNVLLSWSNGGGATSYDVYFGTDVSPDSTEFMGNQTSTTYSPGILSDDTTYYWRIDSKNVNGSTRGDVWSFTTIQDDQTPTFIPIPGRKDHVFDPVNQILYTTTHSGTVDRYDVITGNFLSPWTIGGTLGGIDVTPNGDTVLVADQSFDTITDVGYIHRVDVHSGIVTTLEFPLGGHQFDGSVLSFDPLNNRLFVSVSEGILPIEIAVPIDESTEDFETNDFSKFPWEHSGDTYWAVTSQESHSGLYSAKAGSISHNEVTTLQVTLECSAGNTTFYRKVSSESGYDCLEFYIDGQLEEQWSGEQDWDVVSFPVTAGAKTFKWTYSKDSSVSRGDDTAWIDDIVFPAADELQTEANAQMLFNQSISGGFVERTYTQIEISVEK